MPNRDGTGPLGQGAKTGRKLGKCSNNTENSDNLNFFGRMKRKRKGGAGRNKNGRGQGYGRNSKN